MPRETLSLGLTIGSLAVLLFPASTATQPASFPQPSSLHLFPHGPLIHDLPQVLPPPNLSGKSDSLLFIHLVMYSSVFVQQAFTQQLLATPWLPYLLPLRNI